MARNKVQFQKGLSEGRFDDLCGTEQRCRDAVFGWRWPGGFVCPACGGREHSLLKTRALYQCTACRRQTSLTAGTIFAASKLPGNALETQAAAIEPEPTILAEPEAVPPIATAKLRKTGLAAALLHPREERLVGIIQALQ